MNEQRVWVKDLSADDARFLQLMNAAAISGCTLIDFFSERDGEGDFPRKGRLIVMRVEDIATYLWLSNRGSIRLCTTEAAVEGKRGVEKFPMAKADAERVFAEVGINLTIK